MRNYVQALFDRRQLESYSPASCLCGCDIRRILQFDTMGELNVERARWIVANNSARSTATTDLLTDFERCDRHDEISDTIQRTQTKSAGRIYRA